MKAIFRKLGKKAKDEKGQGLVEYILLLVIVVGIVMLFKDTIGDKIRTAVDNLGNEINSVDSQF